MEQDFYEILGVSRDADSTTIRQAFKRLALTNHPDKVAESERPAAEVRFKIISEAYEVLINEETRILYDAQSSFTGSNASPYEDWQDYYYDSDGHPMPNFYDFTPENQPYQDNSYARNQSWGRLRTEDAQFDVDLILEDVYFGKMIKLKTQRQVLCRRCHGTGGRPQARRYRCQICKGLGTTKKTQWVGPSLLSTSTGLCDVCHGLGEIFRDKDLCRRCKGSRMQELNTIIEVYVPKGVKNRHRIVVEGQADEEPGKQTGDLVITVHIDPHHSVFRREGADLYACAQISLRESLTGFSRPLIKHLDGRELKPTVPRGQIIQPQSILKIPGEGLIIEENVNGRYEDFTGDLYLQIAVDFPTSIEPHILDKVARLLTTEPSLEEEELDGEVSDDTLNYASDEKISPHRSPEFSPENAGNGMVADVDYELLTEADLPEYKSDANDEPAVEPEPEKEKRSASSANFPSHANPLPGCTTM